MSLDVHKIWSDVVANRKRLELCPRHLFERVDHVRIGVKRECLHCHGNMTLTDIGSYIAGYIANGGTAEDIWPGYYGSKKP